MWSTTMIQTQLVVRSVFDDVCDVLHSYRRLMNRHVAVSPDVAKSACCNAGAINLLIQSYSTLTLSCAQFKFKSDYLSLVGRRYNHNAGILVAPKVVNGNY